MYENVLQINVSVTTIEKSTMKNFNILNDSRTLPQTTNVDGIIEQYKSLSTKYIKIHPVAKGFRNR